MTPENKPLEIESLEMKKYQEDLAKEYGLPSPFQTALIKKLCNDMVDSGMVPAHFNGNPMAVYLAAMRGRELGLDPMESIMETFWAMPVKKWNKETRQNEDRGTVMGMYANKMLDIMHRRGIQSKFVEETATRCEILFTPPPASKHESYTASFTFKEAEDAGLVKDYSAWKNWPIAMCRARAISIGWRSMNGVVGKGANLYSKEELEDIQYETVAPSSNGSPEVQVPREEPAKAGRKPKDRPINVTAETVTTATDAAPTPQTSPTNGPTSPSSGATSPSKTADAAPTPEPAATYYVIPSDAKMPALDKLEPGPIEKLNIAALKTADLPEAMKTSDQATKATGTSHYVLQFKDGKASILHTSKLPEEKPKPAPRMYIVAPEPQVKALAQIASETNAKRTPEERSRAVAEITALAVQAPHADLSTCEVVAQAKANATGVVHLVLYLLGDGPEKGTYQLQSKAMPPTASAPGPAQKPVEAGSEEEIRTRVKGKYEWLKNQVPQSVPTAKQRAAIVHQYLMAYLGIAQIADFSKDLVLAEQALLACEADLARDPVELVAHPVELGKAARGLAGSYVAPAETPKMSNGEIAAMAKYYQERGWSGQTTSMAEVYRRAEKPEPSEFQKMLKFAGIEVLGDRDAAAYFAVSTHYEKETAKKFAMAVDATKYGETLTAIRDEYDGKELKEIPAHQFVKGLENVLSPEPDEPNLFGGQ